MMRRILTLLAVLLCAASVRAAEGPNGAYVKTDYVLFPIPASVNPMVVTDANGYLVVKNNTQTAPLGPARPMSNTPLTTDSNNYLMVSCSGCATAPLTLAAPANTAVLIGTSSHTGADATTIYNLSHTLNTSGVPTVFKLAVTDTAHGAGTGIFQLLGGAAAATNLFKVDTAGQITSVDTNTSATSPTFTGSNTAYGFGPGPTGVGLSVVLNSAVTFSFGISNFNQLQAGSASGFCFNSATGLSSGSIDTCLKRSAANVVSVETGTAGTLATLKAATTNVTSGYQVNGVATILNVASNFTTAANTNLQTITGLTVALPASTALNVPFQCKILWSQATAAVAVSFGVQSDTLAPTSFSALGQMETNLTVTSYGDIQNLTSTTATAVVTGTPNATATIYNAYIDGFLENPNGAATNLNIMVKTATAADAVTVYRGSFCRLF